MTDFHSHILPEIDDGSRSVQESLAMLNLLSQQGIHRVIASPHFYANDESVSDFLLRRRKAYEKLSACLTDEMPEIVQGAEVRYYEGISRMKDLKSLCVQGTSLLLMEMPERKWPDYTLRELNDIASDGRIKLVLAHIERCMGFQSKSTFYGMLQNDVLMQINASFINGFFSQRKALKLLGKGEVQFVGSDCHNMAERAPDIGSAYKKIENKFGPEFLAGFNNFTEKFFGEIHILKG